MYQQPIHFFEPMKGQQKVNIGGVVFYVEEQCSATLKQQIALIQSRHLLITDERLAELLLDQLREQGRDVLCGKMVEDAIRRARDSRKPD